MWFWLALSYAVLSSLNNLIFKILLKRVDEFVGIWLATLFGLPIIALFILLFYEIPEIDKYFLFGILGTVILNIFAGIFIFRAYKMVDISLVAPMAAFTPLFTTLFSFCVLREAPSAKGVVGILLVVVGAYLLEIRSWQKGLFTPFKNLFSQPGLAFALSANFLWGITPVFEKIAIQHTFPVTPIFVSLVGGICLALVYFPIMLKQSKNWQQQMTSVWKGFLLTGIIGGIAASAAFTVFNLTYLGYATAAFRLSMVLTVILGWLFLKEKGIKQRFLGVMVMLAGVLLLI